MFRKYIIMSAIIFIIIANTLFFQIVFLDTIQLNMSVNNIFVYIYVYVIGNDKN